MSATMSRALPVFLVLALGALFFAGSGSSGLGSASLQNERAAEPEPLIREAPELWGASADGLQMSMTAVPARIDSEQKPEFYVAFRNAGRQDFFLNLGATLANGRNHYPTAIRLVITDAEGRSKELQHRGFRVAGRADDYAVALGVGSIHILKISLDQFWCPDTKELELALPKGEYRIAAQFTGTGALRSSRLWTAWNFWKGVSKSNLLEFTISQ